jgi:hypothetical protein
MIDEVDFVSSLPPKGAVQSTFLSRKSAIYAPVVHSSSQFSELSTSGMDVVPSRLNGRQRCTMPKRYYLICFCRNLMRVMRMRCSGWYAFFQSVDVAVILISVDARR